MRSIATVCVLLLLTLLVSGLVFNAATRMREAAARMTCRNNLKQISLALHGYHHSMNVFPPATMPNPDLPPNHRLSWLVSIVPYIEATPLHSQMKREKGWDAEENRFAALLYDFSTFGCPGYPMQRPDSPFIPTHYIGMAGLGSDAAELPLDDPRAGVFGYDRKLRLRDIEGPAGNLVMVMETCRASGAWTAGGTSTVRGLETDAVPCLGSDQSFGGNHRAGTNAAFADGSVRFLSESIDPGVMRAIVTVRGSREVDRIFEE